MHEELLERRLRAALHDEADLMAFTITAAELERRMALRGRRSGNARLTLLLAAAVAIGALGGGVLIGALANRPSPSPVALATATPASTETSPPPLLPSLDDLMGADPARVLVAQAFGPADGPGDPVPDAVMHSNPAVPTVGLGVLQGGGDYRVSVACLGGVPLEVALMPTGSNDAMDGPTFACDGSVRDETIHAEGSVRAFLSFGDPTSWRVVVRGNLRSLPLPTLDPVLPQPPEGIDEIVRLDDATVEGSTEAWGSSGLWIRQIEPVPARVVYAAQVWCEPGASVRLLFADRIESVLTPAIETALACDGLVHDLHLPLALPNGSPVMVAAAPSTHWSVVVASATPPVALADDVPGWQQAGGIGPSLHFEDTEVSFSDVAGEDGGPLTVVVACAGPAMDIDVHVDAEGILGDQYQTYRVPCAPQGAQTSMQFDTAATGYIVSHDAPAGTWTALTLLIPQASPGP